MSVVLLVLACSEHPSVALDAAHVVQRPDFCGEACVEMALRRLGHDADQDAVFAASGLDPLLGRGLVTRELRETLLAVGFDVGATWYRGDVQDQWDALYADLAAGVPSIVCMWTAEGGSEHFRMVTGYSALTDTVVFEDPADEEGASEMRLARFLALWPLIDADGPFYVRLRLLPGAILSIPPATEGVDAAALAQAVRRARQVAPVNATFRLVPPFVLIGDEPEATVDARAALLYRTLSLFRADYFDTELTEPWEIWLFRDADSYRRNTFALYSEYPSTPYGFADGNHRSLVMNIATGGGTLVHELAHPYINADIPWVPTWFNEGFASLFEQVGEVDGHLVGFVNWRLPTLQRHIAMGNVPSLADFMAQDADTFRGDQVALNYAMARYLCYYLQEHGLLQAYYRAMKAHPEDPTGLATLQGVLNEPDMVDFQRRWELWVG